jgi:hypothetical protein
MVFVGMLLQEAYFVSLPFFLQQTILGEKWWGAQG